MSRPTPAAAADPGPRTLSQALNDRIRQLLRQKRWSQREFARRLGVTQGAVSYLLAEKRRAAVLDYYERLAGVFGVSLSALIADLEDRIGKSISPEGERPHVASAAPPDLTITALAGLDPTRIPLPTDPEQLAAFTAAYQAVALAFDARVQHRIAVAFDEFQQRRLAAPPRKRRAAPKKRAHGRSTRRTAPPPHTATGQALPRGRDPSDRSV